MGIDDEELAAGLSAMGLVVLGAFAPAMEDEVPVPPGAGPCRSLVLVGNAGAAMWRAYAASGGPGAGSLDGWCEAGLAPLAGRLGAVPLFPWERPHHPFQRWLRRAGRTFASPIGIDIHPEYGLWWGLRGALAFPTRRDVQPPPAGPGPCESCAERPCLATCPVGAFAAEGYDLAACAGHLATPAGADCMTLACRARRACPVGAAYRHGPAQAAFHMAAFLAARRAEQ